MKPELSFADVLLTFYDIYNNYLYKNCFCTISPFVNDEPFWITFMWRFKHITVYVVLRKHFLKVSGNSEAIASELLENLQEMFPNLHLWRQYTVMHPCIDPTKFWPNFLIVLAIFLIYCLKCLLFHLFFQIVTEEGGFEAVTKERRWTKIGSRLGYPSSKGVGSTLRSHYDRILYPFDLFNAGVTVPNVRLCKVNDLGECLFLELFKSEKRWTLDDAIFVFLMIWWTCYKSLCM